MGKEKGRVLAGTSKRRQRAGAAAMLAVFSVLVLPDVCGRPASVDELGGFVVRLAIGTFGYVWAHEVSHAAMYLANGVRLQELTWRWRPSWLPLVPTAVGTDKTVTVGAVREAMLAVFVLAAGVSMAALLVAPSRGEWQRALPRLWLWLQVLWAWFSAWNDGWWLWDLRGYEREKRVRDLGDMVVEV
jgi:hypothetical protein